MQRFAGVVRIPFGMSDIDWPGLTDAQWDAIRFVLPRPAKRPFLKRLRKGGRTRASDKKCFEAILWTIWAGGTLERLPRRFGRRRTVCRRLRNWLPTGILGKLWEYYLLMLPEAEQREWLLRVRIRDAFPRQPYWFTEMAGGARLVFAAEFRALDAQARTSAPKTAAPV